MAAKRKPRKGFIRSQKEWEESLAGHIGKFVDNLKGEDALNLLAAGLCAWAGWSAAQSRGADTNISLGMASSGIVAYQIAKSPNIVASSGAAVYLASIGVIAAWDPITQAIEEAAKNIFPFYVEKVQSPVMSHGITIPLLFKVFP